MRAACLIPTRSFVIFSITRMVQKIMSLAPFPPILICSVIVRVDRVVFNNFPCYRDSEPVLGRIGLDKISSRRKQFAILRHQCPKNFRIKRGKILRRWHVNGHTTWTIAKNGRRGFFNMCSENLSTNIDRVSPSEFCRSNLIREIFADFHLVLDAGIYSWIRRFNYSLWQ